MTQQPDTAAEIRATAESRLCGKTVAVSGATYPPCARTAGHHEAYCRNSTYSSYFIAAPAETEEPTSPARRDDRCPGFCIPCITDESHHPAP